MTSYINIIENMILFCLIICLAQTVTATNPEQRKCCIKMDEYCSNQPPLDDYNEAAVDAGQEPSAQLLLRWQYLSVTDCAKAEVLKWKSDPNVPNEDERLNNEYIVDYRREILEHIEYGNFLLPDAFCQDQGFMVQEHLDNCIQHLIRTFGDVHDVIHTYALQETTLVDIEEEGNDYAAIEADYLEEISRFTFLTDRSELPYPFEYCKRENPDEQVSTTVETLDSPSSSMTTPLLSDFI